MTENFKILAEFIKDMSSETPDVQSYLFVKDNISKYNLNIDIKSNALKNKLVGIDTTLKFEDKELNDRKSHFEITYTAVVKIEDNVKDKKDLEKIISCDVPTQVYPRLQKIFINLLTDSGFPGIKFEKKIDFKKLYKERSG